MPNYRDLLIERYPNDSDIGSVAGCGLSRLDRPATEEDIGLAVAFFQTFRAVMAPQAINERRQAVTDYIETGEVKEWVYRHWLKQSQPLDEAKSEPVYQGLTEILWHMNRHLSTCQSDRREALTRFDEIQQGLEIIKSLLRCLSDRNHLRTLYAVDVARLNVLGVFAKCEAVITQWQIWCEQLAQTLDVSLVITGQNQPLHTQPAIDWDLYVSLGVDYGLLEKQWLTGRQVLIKVPAE